MSPSLLQAQERLVELREQVRQRNGAYSPAAAAHGRSPSPTSNVDNQNSAPLAGPIEEQSDPFTELAPITRRGTGREITSPSQGNEQECLASHEQGVQSSCHRPPANSPANDPNSRLIKLYPDIAMAMLRQQLAAPGRLWVLLRYIDSAGQGWIDIAQARRRLSDRQSPLRVVGWRQMRKLLARGEGLFWRRDSRRIWLRSPIKVAASLGVSRLHHYPVGVPAEVMLQSIGVVRAHLYAAFHSGRTPEKEKSARPMPIARATLQELSQASRRTLRQYEARADVRKQRNFAIGRPHRVADHQDQAWERGRAVFRVRDHSGRVGQAGTAYTVWQLPNSYCGPHEKQPKGRQKRMNRKLADLFMKGMTGNGKLVEQSHATNNDGQRRFFDSGKAAATTYNRSADHDIYWRNKSGASRPTQLWHWLPQQDAAKAATRGRI